MHLLAVLAVAALASDPASVKQAQTGCSLGTLTEKIAGVDEDADQTPWPVLPTNIVIDLDASTVADKRIGEAAGSWTRVCTEAGSLPCRGACPATAWVRSLRRASPRPSTTGSI